jgi:3,4-dehydroadipyl-CoA semialdehyde dehydrogenase
VNKAQQASCLEGLRRLKRECAVVFGGDENFQPLDADRTKSAFVQPTLLACENGVDASFVHDVEVFGPAATLIAYDSTEEMIALVRRGLGSLVASIFANDPAFLKTVVLGIGDLHGRIMVVDSSVGTQYTGHGNVVPSCLHGGPGRAGGGEELAGLRALLLYHRRFVVQGPPSVTSALADRSTDTASLYA